MFTVTRKKTGNGLAAGCQLFYRKIYGYFLQCTTLDRTLLQSLAVLGKKESALTELVILSLKNFADAAITSA